MAKVELSGSRDLPDFCQPSQHAKCGRAPTLRRSRISQAKFEAVAIDILSEAGHPMRRKSLRSAFGLRSINIGGVNPEKNFGTKLWKAVNRPNAPLSYDKEAGYGIRLESESSS
jgi:hypothetical protein